MKRSTNQSVGGKKAIETLKRVAAASPKACCAGCAAGTGCSGRPSTVRLRELLASLVEEVPDVCPTLPKAIAALDSKSTTVRRLRLLLGKLGEEAPDVCPTRRPALFAASGSNIDLQACARAAWEAGREASRYAERFDAPWDDLDPHARDVAYDTAIAVLAAAGLRRLP